MARSPCTLSLVSVFSPSLQFHLATRAINLPFKKKLKVAPCSSLHLSLLWQNPRMSTHRIAPAMGFPAVPFLWKQKNLQWRVPGTWQNLPSGLGSVASTPWSWFASMSFSMLILLKRSWTRDQRWVEMEGVGKGKNWDASGKVIACFLFKNNTVYFSYFCALVLSAIGHLAGCAVGLAWFETWFWNCEINHFMSLMCWW